MIVECPKCKNEKEIKFVNGLLCDHCKEDISNYKYKKKAIVATATLLIGAGSGYMVDKYILSETRYPLEIENAIMEHCRNGHSSLISQETHAKINEKCICALSNTLKEVSYSDVKKDTTNFLRQFDKQVATCKK